MNDSDIEYKIEQEWKRQKEEMKNSKVNIIIAGGTGVGKSSLINFIFGENIAQVGVGKPITKGIHKYEKETLPIRFYDTEGYELNDGSIDNNNFKHKIIPFIKESKNKELTKQIHLAWYCISITNNRITNFDIENIKLLNNILYKKCAIVFTQCDNDEETEDGKGVKAEEFKRILKKEKINSPIFETSIQKDLPLDIEELLEWSRNALDDDTLRESFVSSQKKSVSLKFKEAIKVVEKRALAASAAGASPIPFSDSVIISGLQIEMMIKIANIFDMNNLGKQFTNVLQTQIISQAGRLAASELTKLVPGLGSVINATIAGTITYALGYGTAKIFEKGYKEYLDTGKIPDWIELFSGSIFTKYFEEAFNYWKER